MSSMHRIEREDALRVAVAVGHVLEQGVDPGSQVRRVSPPVLNPTDWGREFWSL